MKVITAILSTAVGGLMWRGLDKAMEQGEIIAFSRRRFVDMVSMAEDPTRFGFSVVAHVIILTAAVVVTFLALIERPSNRIGRRRR